MRQSLVCISNETQIGFDFVFPDLLCVSHNYSPANLPNENVRRIAVYLSLFLGANAARST